MQKTWEGINNVLARKLKNTKPITFIKDPNDNDSVTSDPSRIVNVLNDHFTSDLNWQISYQPFSVIISIFFTLLTLRLLST